MDTPDAGTIGMTPTTRVVAHPYRRTDGKLEARWVAGNGQVIATTGSQGYEDEADLQHAIDLVAEWGRAGAPRAELF